MFNNAYIYHHITYIYIFIYILLNIHIYIYIYICKRIQFYSQAELPCYSYTNPAQPTEVLWATPTIPGVNHYV